MTAGDEAYRQGHLGEAERHWTAGLELEARMGSTRSLDNLAMLYQAQGKYTEAEPLHARALAIMDRTPGPNPPGLSERLKIHAAVLRKLGRDAEAAKKEARATAIRKTKPAPERARRLGWTRLWRWLLRRRKRTAKVATARAGRRKTPE